MARNILALLLISTFASTAPSFAADATATFDVERMTCTLCPVTVRKAMQDVEGVIEAKVDYDKKTATVTFDDARTTPDDIAKASTEIGYPASLAQD